MSEVVEPIIDFRIDIDVEYQDWILFGTVLLAVWLFCLPCMCAGLSSPLPRRFTKFLQSKQLCYYVLITLFNITMISLVLTWLPSWTAEDFGESIASDIKWLNVHVFAASKSILRLLLFFIAFLFRDRIFTVLGVEDVPFLKFRLSDCLTCFSARHLRPIEVSIWKVEDVKPGNIFSANNVYCEVTLGLNETRKTRVHNNVGSSCDIKQSVQLNFDERDQYDHLTIHVKNQKAVGVETLGSLTLTCGEVKKIETTTSASGMNWDDHSFSREELQNGGGSIWIRIAPVIEERSAWHTLTA